MFPYILILKTTEHYAKNTVLNIPRSLLGRHLSGSKKTHNRIFQLTQSKSA